MIRSLLRVALVFTLAAPVLRAQTPCHAENDGNAFADNVSTGGVLIGVRFTAPSSFSCNRIEVFTGEVSGTSSVAIWSHDVAANEPNAPLSTGTWSMTFANSWQGANLPSAVSLSSGATYWMVWGAVNFSQASVDVPMASLGQVYRGSFDGGANWNGPFQFNDRHWKFRLFGNCAGGFTSLCFGDGTLPTACPCGNTGLSARGCDNSLATGGAVMTAAGTTTPDTLVLTSSGELPTTLSIFLQGTANNASGVVFGDGVRCVAGVLKRLYVKNAVGGTVSAPAPGDPSISAQSAALGDPIAPGSLRWYQVYYRDPNLTFCAPPAGDSWNVSSGMQVGW